MNTWGDISTHQTALQAEMRLRENAAQHRGRKPRQVTVSLRGIIARVTIPAQRPEPAEMPISERRLSPDNL